MEAVKTEKKIKLKYSALSNMTFMQTMQKLNNTPLDHKVAYTLKKLTDALTPAMRTIREEYKAKVLDNFAKKDDNGELAKPENPGGRAFVILEGKEKEFDAAEKAFGENTLTLDRRPIPLYELAEVKMTAAELSAIEDFLDFDAVPDQMPLFPGQN